MMPERCLVSVGFLVDTNCVNAKQKIAEMNLLELWAENGIIELITAETAQKEMAAGRDAFRTRKAYRFIATMSVITTQQEQQQVRKIEEILCPNGVATQNERNDIDIVFNAGKYLRPLITNDGASRSQPGGILGNRAKLSQLGIQVLSPKEAVERVRKALRERDDDARQCSALYKEDLPDWVGKDC